MAAIAEDIPALQYGAGIIGVDEVGRGCLSGPVYAAAVLANQSLINQGITDSKVLSLKTRQKLNVLIRERCIYAVACATVEEILLLNIRQASLLAMKRAIELLWTRISLQSQQQTSIIIDGNVLPELSDHITAPIRTEISGDKRFISVGAASIIAKIARDTYMTIAADSFPEYGWNRNAGYGTSEHKHALLQYGITPLHRRSFRPIKDIYDRQHLPE